MDWKRVAELYSGGNQGAHGTGYLLAPGLLLTARHVVQGLAATEVRLIVPDGDGLPGGVGPWQAARVAWTASQPDVDLALLAPAGKAKSFRELTGSTTIARLDGRAPIRVDALGFPRAMLTPTHSDTLRLEAAVDAWSGVRSDALLLKVHTPLPAKADGWKGMSGAAVFAGDRLVGVVEAVPGDFQLSTLRATPAHALSAIDEAAALLRAASVPFAAKYVDAAYVDALPRSGQWGGLREEYTRAVVTTLLRIDQVGLAVSGAPDRKIPALAAYDARRYRLGWSDASTRPDLKTS